MYTGHPEIDVSTDALAPTATGDQLVSCRLEFVYVRFWVWLTSSDFE